jgi:hypothetical protein
MPPVIHVLLGIAQDLAFAGGAAGGMNAHDLLKGYRTEGKGVAVPKVFPRGQRQFLYITKAVNIFR